MGEFSKTYEAKEIEDKIYKEWEDSGFFSPEIDKKKKPFVISMPPPNATGILHIGHAMFVTLQDLMTRYHRLCGEPTLWLPGTDHAAIASQAKVEKILLKEEKKTRYDLGREKFLKRVEEYVENSRKIIRKQIRKLGASCDWSRERFTLDEGLSHAVREIFVRMYNDGLIYRGERIVNWCLRCSSTLADDEVEYREAQSKLYYLKYGPFVVATTRPETKLGDTGLAVHPRDRRYKKYVGQELDIDLAGHKIRVKVFADREVDQNFGSGVIGVTPAHSYVDYEWAQKNDLKIIQVIGPDGKMTDQAGKYAGLTVKEARKNFIEDLVRAGLLEKEEDYTSNLSLCYRCETPIEPLMSKQWFVDINKKILVRGHKSLKELSLEVVKSGQIKIIPEHFKKIYYHWLENLRPWCISRQIWYGHRIPVWYCENEKCKASGEEPIVTVRPVNKCLNCGGRDFRQDPDTLDTWFSSGLWTFSTLGWPEETEDLKYFHPTTVMETAYDILFFWVARMIIMSQYALGEIPFKNVYLHGLVRDEQGRKMSKSLGNVIDPLEMIERFGTDAVRLSLVINMTSGNDSRISEEKIAGFRNFVNKFWNIARFISSQKDEPAGEETLADRWIFSRLNQVIESVNQDLETFRFSRAGETLKAFTWEELANWYLEISKIETGKKERLEEILRKLLILWHPFTPFVTEKIYQNNEKLKKAEFLMVEKWPSADKKAIAKNVQRDFGLIQEIITVIRNARAAYHLEPARKIPVIISAGAQTALLEDQKEVIKFLARLSEIKIEKKTAKPKDAISLVIKNLEIYLEIADIVDVKKEKKCLTEEIKKLEIYSKSVKKKLANKEFIVKAPVEVVEQEKEKLAQILNNLNKLRAQIEGLK